MLYNDLPSKFWPYVIGHPQFNGESKINQDSISREFKNKEMVNKHVFKSQNYFFKARRNDILTTPDTHLYRVRKAVKIAKYIEDNQLEDSLVVPKKYLYWSKEDQRFYVVSEKIELSEEAIEFNSEIVERFMNSSEQKQVKRRLTLKQVKALAELAFSAGYDDQHVNNLFFTTSGQVAIIDTEPPYRHIKKRYVWKYIFGKETASVMLAFKSISYLKLGIRDSNILKEVDQVVRTHVLWFISKSIAKLFIFVLITNRLLWIQKPQEKITQFLILFLTACSVFIFVTGILNVCRNWYYSCQGLKGLAVIEDKEKEWLPIIQNLENEITAKSLQ